MSASGKKFAVFDFDGTLIRWQLYHAVVDKLAKCGALGADAQQQLKEARMSWKRREHPEAFKEYEKQLIGIYEAALPALSVEKFDQMVQEVVEEYKDQVYIYTRDLIKQLKKNGYFLMAISGSHTELVAEIAKYYQFDDFVGTRYGRKAGRFSGMEFLASKDKRAVLKGLVEKHSLSYPKSFGVGDSLSDGSMLEMVDNPIAFNPDHPLFDLAKKNGWKIVIERKSVIYELEPKDGNYILA